MLIFLATREARLSRVDEILSGGSFPDSDGREITNAIDFVIKRWIVAIEINIWNLDVRTRVMNVI